MNKKGLIIINAFLYKDAVKYQVNKYIKAFNKINIDIEVISNIIIYIYIDEKGNIKDELKNKNYSFIIYLDKDKYLASLLEKAGYKLFNNAKSIEICDDKMLTHIVLSNNNILMPKTYSYPLNYSNNFIPEINKFNKTIINNLKFPFLIKENFGSLGEQVYLINNKTELELKQKELINKPHIYQQFIKESIGIDYRLLIIGYKYVASLKRVNNNSFVSNIAKGGIGHKFDPPIELINLSIKVSKILHLDYCAIDYVLNKNNDYILIEVNSNAFFKELERINNIDISSIFANYINLKIN